jgi:hypothetical protein
MWFRKGRLHRGGDLPAFIDFEDNISWWYQNGRLHRAGGRPALVSNNVDGTTVGFVIFALEGNLRFC